MWHYVCTVVNPDHGQYAEISINDAQEFSTSFVLTSNGNDLLQLVSDDGSSFFADSRNLKFKSYWKHLIVAGTSSVSVRSVYAQEQFSGLPIMFRIYVDVEYFIGKLTTIASMNVEETLSGIITTATGFIIKEPIKSLPVKLSLPCVNVKNEWPLIPKNAFTVPTKRDVSNDQKAMVQSILNISTQASQDLSVIQNLIICPSLFLDVDVGLFEDTKKLTSWTPKAGIIAAPRGSGRRRVISSALQYISTGAVLSYSEKDITKFSAPQISIIFCKHETIDKWKKETDIRFVIHERKDLFALTHAELLKGGIIIITREGLALLQEQEQKALDDIRDLYSENTNMTIVPSFTVCMRYFVSGFAKRFPNSTAVLRWIRPKCCIIDDIVDITGTDIDLYEKRQIMFDMALIQANWTWIHVQTNGPAPPYCPMSWLNICSPFMNFPSTATMYDIDQIDVQVIPSIWNAFHENNFYVRIRVPSVILRKIMAIPVSVAMNVNEQTFYDVFKKVQQSMTTTPIKPLLMIPESLLNGNLENVNGINLTAIFKRLGDMSKSDVIKSCTNHYSTQVKGTVAQRIGEAAAKKMNLGPIINHTLATKDFVLQSIQQDHICQVCMCDPSTCFTTCGHAYCKSCSDMIRTNETKNSIVTCPVCRAALSLYDWMMTAESPVPANHTLSKFMALRETFGNIFSKRRNKKRTINMEAWLIVPEKVKMTVQEEIVSWNEYDIEKGERHTIHIMTFDNLIASCNTLIPDSIEAIVFASPPEKTKLDVLHALIRTCAHRTSSLPVYFLFAYLPHADSFPIENIRPTMRLLVETEEPVRRFIRNRETA